MNEESVQNNISGNMTGNYIGGSAEGNTISFKQITTPESQNSQQMNIPDLIGKLREAIENDSKLSEEKKKTALAQVLILNKAVKNPQSEEKKNQAETATFTLDGMIKRLPEAVSFVEACNKLLPLITRAIGI